MSTPLHQIRSVPSQGVSDFMNYIADRNPHEPEFLQAVGEVAASVIPFMESHPQYKEARLLERMAEPERLIQFRVVWQDDQGRVQVNRGYRVQMSSAIGPYKGGLRFHPTVTASVLKFLAFEQVFKNALTTLPLGGGKGGADFNPKGKSDAEVMRFCQSFMTELWRHIGSDTDVPAGDIGVGAREIGYMFGQYKRLSNSFQGVLTGKGMAYGGSMIRPEATGYGLVYFTQELLEAHQHGIEGARCLISGSGNVAQYAAEKLIQLGARVITFSDSTGFVHDADGVTPEKLSYLKTIKNEHRLPLSQYAEHFGLSWYAQQQPWGVAADVALPCATQNEIDESAARLLVSNGVHTVSEGANMPCSREAIQLFREAGVRYAPGKATNAGGVAVSGLEMSQNSQRTQWSAEEVDQRLITIMHNIHGQCCRYGETNTGIDYEKGANIAGFVKVAEAMLAQGMV